VRRVSSPRFECNRRLIKAVSGGAWQDEAVYWKEAFSSRTNMDWEEIHENCIVQHIMILYCIIDAQ
jgi:hypothetical protein